MDERLLKFLGREREERVRVGERECVLRLLSARETLTLRREIAQLDCADEEERALRANAAGTSAAVRGEETPLRETARETDGTETFSRSLERDARRYDGGFLFY